MSYEPIPYATPVVAVPEGGRSRRGGLIAFGVASILLGMPPALMAASSLFAIVRILTRPRAALGLPTWALFAVATVFVVFSAMATVFIWTGVGSIRCRRWVRAVVLALGWPTIVCGILGVIGFPLVAFEIDRRDGTNSGTEIAIATGVLTIFTILVPGAFVWFYSRPSVRQTLEAFDPTPSWTERTTARLFVACANLVLWALPTGLLALIGSVPFFGTYVEGPAAAVIVLAAAAVMVTSAVLMYLGVTSGWWAAFAVVAGGFMSAIITFYRSGMTEFYRRGGMAEYELRQVQELSTLSGVTPIVFVVVAMSVCLGLLLWVRGDVGGDRRAGLAS